MATKEPRLGLYLVKSTREEFTDSDGVLYPAQSKAYLVIAQSADRAAEYVAFQPGKPFEQVPEDGVGRLGDYDPGIEGHRSVAALASYHHNGVIILTEEVPA